jgi:hypothetical protein
VVVVNEFLLAMGIPTTIMGLLVWWLKRYIDKRDQAAMERERDIEKLMLMIIQTSRANNVLAEATARAVQRIPDAHCNGDMTSALERASKIQKEEQEFLMDKGIRHLFGD